MNRRRDPVRLTVPVAGTVLDLLRRRKEEKGGDDGWWAFPMVDNGGWVGRSGSRRGAAFLAERMR